MSNGLKPPYQQQPPVTTVSGGLPAAKQPPKRRSQAIKIINPDSGRNVLDDLTKGSEEAKKEEANVSFDLSRRDDTAAYNTLQIMTQLSTFLTFFLLLEQAFCFAAKEKLNLLH